MPHANKASQIDKQKRISSSMVADDQKIRKSARPSEGTNTKKAGATVSKIASSVKSSVKGVVKSLGKTTGRRSPGMH